uniref:Adhesion G protein-coupled receptor D2 n=1 Tax=Monodon monoceros TaxID=40151 RepID=A0A8C6C3R0_MONMO
TPQVNQGTLGSQVAPVAPGEVVETADEVCKFPGQWLSWWQPQESCEQRFGHVVLQHPDAVLAPRLPDPIWVGKREAPLQRPPQRHECARTAAALTFGERTAGQAAWLRTPLPALGALTACVHVQWNAASSDAAALFSLAVPALANALQLRAFAEPGGAVHAALAVREHHAPFRAAFRADGRWHHVCATWEQLGGRWALFADGRRRAGARGLGASHPLPPGGILVLGQDQDSLGGAPLSCTGHGPARRTPAGLLFRWDLGALDVTPTVLPPVRVQLLCLGTDPGPRTDGFLFCLQPLPFLCCYRTETYQQLQDAQSWSGQDVISQVNALANAIVVSPVPGAHGDLSLAEASSFLGILERVLTKETASLGPAALLAVMHFLKSVAALGTWEPEPMTRPWEQLGQAVVSGASLILEEQLRMTWLRRVVGGPKALVASKQCGAPLLSTMLTSERPRTHIQHHHAGLSGVTMIHSWFSSSVFQYTLGAPGQEPQAPDTSEEASRMQRFLSTQVGLAIISSEVWDETGEANTAVTFHLQHWPISRALCSLFTPSPDSGGSWATTGCSVTALYQDSTTCFCNHSAVLSQVYDIQGPRRGGSLLRTLSSVGCGVSCALATTFLLFLASERATVHKNLTFSLASAEGFLVANEWAKANKVACVAVTAVTHLLFLVVFSWMLAEGLPLCSKVVAVRMRLGPRKPLCYATGWGVPVAMVAITLAVSPHDYVATGHCRLNVHTDTIWAFVGPVLTVSQYLHLVCVVIVTVSRARRRARTLSSQPCVQQQIPIQILLSRGAAVKPVLVLLPILSLTWLVSMLVHLSPAWAYATVGLNSLQVPPGPGPVWDQGSTMHWSPEGVAGLSGALGAECWEGGQSKEGPIRPRPALPLSLPCTPQHLFLLSALPTPSSAEPRSLSGLKSEVSHGLTKTSSGNQVQTLSRVPVSQSWASC